MEMSSQGEVRTAQNVCIYPPLAQFRQLLPNGMSSWTSLSNPYLIPKRGIEIKNSTHRKDQYIVLFQLKIVKNKEDAAVG